MQNQLKTEIDPDTEEVSTVLVLTARMRGEIETLQALRKTGATSVPISFGPKGKLTIHLLKESLE